MSLLLGSHLHVPSRCLVDEDEEEAKVTRSYELQVTKPTSTKLLIVTASKLPSAFINVYANHGDGPSFGKIFETESKPELESICRVVASLHQLDEGVVHCHVERIIHQEWLNDFTQTLFQVAPDNGDFRVIALTSDRLVNFRLASNNLDLLEDGGDSDITRHLKSSKWETTSKLPLPRLEQPNLIQGVAAAVLTHCHFLAVPGLILVSFTDSEQPDSITMSGFRALFKIPEIGKRLEAEAGTVQARLKKLAALQQKDNLFM